MFAWLLIATNRGAPAFALELPVIESLKLGEARDLSRAFVVADFLDARELRAKPELYCGPR